MTYFSYAQAIFPKGLETEMNRFIGFRALFKTPEAGRILLRITGSSIYRVHLNGQFLAYGPARGPHGYYRVDAVELPEEILHKDGGPSNLLTVELASYNVNSYYLLDQPGFLQAEVMTDSGQLLAATGAANQNFEAYDLTYRLQKTARYSFQRPFTEVYRLNQTSLAWLADAAACPGPRLTCAAVFQKQLLPRRAAFPDYALRQLTKHIASGIVEPTIPPQVWKDRSFSQINPPVFKGFPEAQLEAAPSLEIQQYVSRLTSVETSYDPAAALELPARICHILDFGGNYSGFIGLRVNVRKPTRLLLSFDEVLTQNDVDFKRLSAIQLIAYELAAGMYTLECFEPYTLRYLKLETLMGDCSVQGVYLREYCNPDIQAEFVCSSPELNLLYAAGIETFRQNTVDIPMDCPSRERAGWLCDSFFISRAAWEVSGHCRIEQNFLENYRLAPPLPQIPKEMFAQCYPADHNDGCFIPQWAMWLVLELEEYPHRGGDDVLVKRFEPKIQALLGWFARFHNSDGLLENMQGCNFVEWSAANKFTKDVNYPSNMLYAAALRAAARLYQRPELNRQAEEIVRTVCRQSFDGQFFIDNAIRSADGVLSPTRNRTEICQYYAFFSETATPQSHPELWRTLLTQFGPKRRRENPYPEIHFANAFIGNYLRMELLSRYGLSRQVLGEMQDFFVPMARLTHTLWEMMDGQASCNHGFASHVVHWLFGDAGGIQSIDLEKKTVTIRFPEAGISWCRVKRPLADGYVVLEWQRHEQGEVEYRLEVPVGYQAIVVAPQMALHRR